MIHINIAYIVNNTGSNFYGKWVIPLFKQGDGQYMCRFTGNKSADIPVSFEAEDLILAKDFKKKEVNEEIKEIIN